MRQFTWGIVHSRPQEDRDVGSSIEQPGQGEGYSVFAMAAPIVPGKVDTWRGWMSQLSGPRKAEFEASNARHGLTGHHAWLQTNPDGSHVVIVVQDGPGADDYMQSMGTSDDSFDQWFLGNVAEIHGLDLSGPLPPAAERVL